MKEILIPGANEKLYLYKLDNGLQVYMVPNNKTKNFYITLSTKFGSIDTKFEYKGHKYDMPKGIAHYLEHLMFNMPDGSAHDVFSKLGASSNAFTSYDVTCYEVFANNKFKECLEYLIDYVYTPYFTKDNVANERGIITEEIKMYEDSPGSTLINGLLQNIFVSDERRYLVSGTVSDVKKITKEDIDLCYEAFYHPENMFMIITGDFDPSMAVSIITEEMKKKKFKEFVKPTLLRRKEPFKIVTDYSEKEMDLEKNKVAVGFKIPKSSFRSLKLSDSEALLYINLFTRVMFGSTSFLKEELQTSGVITGVISMNLTETSDYFVQVIASSTEFPDYFIKRVKETFALRDVTEDDVRRKVNVSVSNFIMLFDEIEAVNNQIQDDVINYGDYIYDIFNVYKSLNLETLIKVMDKLDKVLVSVFVLKPKKEEE